MLEQLPGAIGAGLSKLLPSLFSGTATDSNGSGMGVIRAEVGGVGDLKDGEMWVLLESRNGGARTEDVTDPLLQDRGLLPRSSIQTTVVQGGRLSYI